MDKIFFVQFSVIGAGLLIIIALWNLILHLLFYKKRKQNDFYEKLLEKNQDIIYQYQYFPKKKFIYVSKEFQNMFGYPVEDLYKNPDCVFFKVHPNDRKELVKKSIGILDYSKPLCMRWLDKDGNYIYTEDYMIPYYKNNQFIGIHGSIRNVTKQKLLERELEYSSNHDFMTDCYNRNYYDQIYEKYNCKENKKVGLILCDLNNLKKINDDRGHKHGDMLIKDTAVILNEFSEENVIVCRIGGDEFTIILMNHKKRQMYEIQDKIKKRVAEYNNLHRKNRLDVAVGCHMIEHSLNQMNQLFSMADQKMYLAKKKMKQREAVKYFASESKMIIDDIESIKT